ncbi:hypothetical protein SAMN05444266_102362 [Chitinophaga jiangningensis]|uniref:Anti-sigma factor n=1 Tax=Chitinophaga jiangningensis TaxID=1419482 RepID=A0A1M6YL07_9BACT|nr:hypothetical protein [Chitinophaga jiangningensis]SHL18755.1 hypothetical protein SAMN05444266_102362 [Chitinophaga jiangningensis]
MSDNFEQFIQQNRTAFEQSGPSPRVWEALEKELGQQKKGRVVSMLSSNWFKAAVIALLIINAGVLFLFVKSRQHQKNDLALMLPEMQEAQVYYSSKIEARLDSIRLYPAGEIGLDSAAMRELELKNDTYKMLEKELKNNPGNERIRAAIIRYYQLKLDLLDKILEELEAKHATPGDLKKQYEEKI